ncbi:MAG: hypothetical protein HPY76_01760 [Anaerolineae bacterium]|nr:hypothetical protein [Anaerolineae bacterium]
MKSAHSKPKRPLWLKMLTLCFLVLAFFGLMRLVGALQYGEWLARFSLPFSPTYLAMGGALWALTGTAAAVWAWFHLHARTWVVAGAAALMALTYWLERLAFTRSQSSQTNLPFALGMTALLLAFAAAATFRMAQDEREKGNGET